MKRESKTHLCIMTHLAHSCCLTIDLGFSVPLTPSVNGFKVASHMSSSGGGGGRCCCMLTSQQPTGKGVAAEISTDLSSPLMSLLTPPLLPSASPSLQPLDLISSLAEANS